MEITGLIGPGPLAERHASDRESRRLDVDPGDQVDQHRVPDERSEDAGYVCVEARRNDAKDPADDPGQAGSPRPSSRWPKSAFGPVCSFNSLVARRLITSLISRLAIGFFAAASSPFSSLLRFGYGPRSTRSRRRQLQTVWSLRSIPPIFLPV